jgi:hypothetical protein
VYRLGKMVAPTLRSSNRPWGLVPYVQEDEEEVVMVKYVE